MEVICVRSDSAHEHRGPLRQYSHALTAILDVLQPEKASCDKVDEAGCDWMTMTPTTVSETPSIEGEHATTDC